MPPRRSSRGSKRDAAEKADKVATRDLIEEDEVENFHKQRDERNGVAAKGFDDDEEEVRVSVSAHCLQAAAARCSTFVPSAHPAASAPLPPHTRNHTGGALRAAARVPQDEVHG